jgi:ribonuclease-3
VKVSGGDPAGLGAILGHEFVDPGLLELALTHPSCAHEVDGSSGNERLEFLGDAVLDLVVAHLLFEAHPDWSEGHLTRTRAALVNGRSLAARARNLGLGEWVRLGRTERQGGGADKHSILANVFEALVGALYLDGGLGPATAFVRRAFGTELAEGLGPPRADPKTRFQEWCHALHRETPRYATVRDSAIEDDDERFEVEVRVGEEPRGRGVGRTKRQAEQRAAEAALRGVETGAPDG